MSPVEDANALDLTSYVANYLPSCRDAAPIVASDGESAWTVTVEDPVSMSRGDLEGCFRLIETTSKEDYLNSSMGWHPRQKKQEMKLPDMRYLLVHETKSATLLAFASFMMTYEDGIEVVYVYEIHISSSLRGKGFGKKLMKMIEDAGRNAGMKKAMLTVFLANTAANAFYKALGYSLDAFSPEPRRLRGGVIKEPDYNILSREL